MAMKRIIALLALAFTVGCSSEESTSTNIPLGAKDNGDGSYTREDGVVIITKDVTASEESRKVAESYFK